MMAESAGYTIGRAFTRAWWVTALIDLVVLGASAWSGWSMAGWLGLSSAGAGWLLAVLFSEVNSAIMALLDHFGVRAQQYLVLMMQLWGAKLLVVVVLGGLYLCFAPYHLTVFCFVLVFTTLVTTVKNGIISAFARIL
ncbi:hypothetical protein B9G54_06040 [Alloscardovia macacae]|uniref:Uncharacterized protein n=1 Tax=Alloscardovia macacae TaxID=1160091 RepID=A0A1Y2SVS4_9BIFI|nr:hypothetical protein [Alloscardovia macacae]OTA26117.1 hypothetical protein B9G54_06040 [Alloscardovia macacae]OTA28582.1 hypothetical protein B9T39_06255 [Alloscardovia macacae]